MRFPRLLSALAGPGLLLLLVLGAPLAPRPAAGPAGDDPFARDLARLERARDHAAPGSAERFKAEQRIERIEKARAGKPAFDKPDQYARILNEMRIPADRTEPEYEAGYRVRELAVAKAARRPAKAILPWREVGPGNVAGRARAIVVDPDDPTASTWFIGSVGGGVWKTTDAGATWEVLTDNFPVLSVQSLAMAPSDPDVMYAGTGESFYNIDTINGNGILKTTDRGLTWTHLAQTVDNPAFNNVARIVVHPTNPDVVLAATTVGRYKESVLPRSSIFKSVDGGLTWTEKYASTTIGTFNRVKKIQQIVADPANFNVLYATIDEGGLLKSTNAGETWTPINTGIADFTGRFELAISPVNTSRLYAAAEGASHSELWISTNGGASWSETTEAGTEPNWLGAQGWYDNTIVCHPTNTNIVYVGGVRLWQITLSGTSRTTSLLSVGPVHVDHHNLVVLPTPGGFRLLNVNDGGVGLSTSAASDWSAPIDGMTTTQFYGIDKRPGASAYFGGMQDNGTWFSPVDPDRLTDWSFAIGGDGYETSWHFDDPQRMIGGYQYNGLQRSLDGGLSWNSAVNGLLDTGSARAPFITKIAKNNAAPDFICAVGRDGVWRSFDFGASWSLTAIPSATWGGISSFHDVKISRADPDVVWGGSRMDATAQIHVSTDAGATFAPVPNFATVTMGGISGLATHPTDPATAYVLFSFAGRPKILRTTDYGATWADITGFVGGSPSTNGFPDVAVYDLLVFSDDPLHMWAGTEIGIVESLDGGATWALANNGLPAVSIWDLTEVEDEVVVGTHGRGIWAATIPELVAGKTFKPLIEAANQGPDGLLAVSLNLRSAYDSTVVRVDGAVAAVLPANAPRDAALVQVPVLSGGTKPVFATGWAGGVPYESITKLVDTYALQAPRWEYANDFETSGAGDFTGSGFSVGPYAGFTGNAIHSTHDYPDNAALTYMLLTPIRVSATNPVMSFNEVAIVEPGDPGTVFGDYAFWDYVVVEGSRDGVNWTPFADGYDCRDDPAWENAFYSSLPGNSSMLRPRSISLVPAFSPGETILVRFRLFADSAVNSWGWAIDDLDIQPGAATGVGDQAPARAVALEQNVPNPFNPQTMIRWTLPLDADVTLRVYDVRGRLVRTLVDERQTAGARAATWDGRDDRGASVASGAYVYRLQAGEVSLQRRMMLVR